MNNKSLHCERIYFTFEAIVLIMFVLKCCKAGSEILRPNPNMPLPDNVTCKHTDRHSVEAVLL